MLAPNEVMAKARKLESKNLKFRSFLKNRADPEELDAQFFELHKELFANYDCSKCNNCCRKYFIIVDKTEIASIAAFLGLTEAGFKAKYLMVNNDQYTMLNRPCEFIDKDGLCIIQSCKPAVCRGFPYTDQPDRLASMYSVLSAAEVCPIVFQILERLKVMYGFI